MEIGKAKYGGEFVKRNNWKLKEGSNLYRILPPLGSLAKLGKWAVFEAMHWGYSDSGGRQHPFRCIRKTDFKSKMVIQECPECSKIEEVKKIYETQLAQLQAKGTSASDAEEFLKPLTDWLMKHNLDKKWHLNVLNQNNEIGRLRIANRSKLNLEAAIAKLGGPMKGISPVDVDGGVWFDFGLSGKGSKSLHPVEVAYEDKMVGGEMVKVLKKAPLTQDILDRLDGEAYDLGLSFTGITAEQIKMMVDSNGDPAVVDTVFGAGTKSEMAKTETPVSLKEVLVSKSKEEEDLLKQLEAFRSTKTSTPSPSVSATENKLSDAEFLSQFGIK